MIYTIYIIYIVDIVPMCRNCEEEVKINEHKCYIRRIRQKGGKCVREICLCKGNFDQYIKSIKDFNLNELRI